MRRFFGRPASVVFTRPEILEEAIHYQQRIKHGDDYFNDSVNFLEIEAQDKLLEIGKKENWKQSQMDEIKQTKASYEKQLKKTKR